MENAINDSKSVSYDGVIRSAYRNHRENGNKITLYRSVNGYLRDSFSRSDLYRAVFLVFWNEQINGVYAFGAGESGPALIQDCRVAADEIVKIMGDEDTGPASCWWARSCTSPETCWTAISSPTPPSS